MFVRRIIGITVTGLTGWLLRLVFVASVAAGIYGVYLAWFASLGQRGPGHDRLAGTIVMGVALGVGLISAPLIVKVRRLRRGAHGHWYVSVFVLFAVLFIATAWPLSAALRGIGTWERSNERVVAVATACSESDDSDGNASYSCTLDWTVNGHAYRQSRPTNAVYPDGTRIELWVDPVTGGADDHDWVPIFWAFFAVAAGLVIDASVIFWRTDSIDHRRVGPGRWARDMAWWRDFSTLRNPAAATTPAGTVEINDAIPAAYRPDDVEDARP